MGITSSTKVMNVTAIPCGGTFNVTLALTAEPDITTNPTDIVLILDRSGSRIGIVSFADAAVQNTGLITSVADLKAAMYVPENGLRLRSS